MKKMLGREWVETNIQVRPGWLGPHTRIRVCGHYGRLRGKLVAVPGAVAAVAVSAQMAYPGDG